MRTDALTSFFTSLFQDSSGITIAATIIRPDELNDMGHRHAFEAMMELSESGKPVDIAHVCDKLQARGFGETQALELLERLTDGSPLPGAIRDYAALIQKAVYKKRLGGLLETASLRNQAHAGDYQNHRTGYGPQRFDERCDLVHLRENLRLFLFHVGFRFIQKKLIVFLHRQSTAVDQQDDQNRGQDTPRT